MCVCVCVFLKLKNLSDPSDRANSKNIMFINFPCVENVNFAAFGSSQIMLKQRCFPSHIFMSKLDIHVQVARSRNMLMVVNWIPFNSKDGMEYPRSFECIGSKSVTCKGPSTGLKPCIWCFYEKTKFYQNLISSLCIRSYFESWLTLLGPLCSTSQTLRNLGFEIGYTHETYYLKSHIVLCKASLAHPSL